MGVPTGGDGEGRVHWRHSWLVVAPASLVVADAWRWRWFVHPDIAIARRAADVLLSGRGLHVYARAPLAQMGPLAIALIRVPHPVYNVIVAALVLPFLLMAGRPLLVDGVSASRRATWLVATTLLIAPWAQLAWKGHADDALVLVGAAAMLTGLSIKRPRWLIAGWTVAIAGKPTALALAPLFLACPSSLWVALALTAAIWGPFFIVEPGAMLRAGQGVMAVVPGDALAYLGVPRGRPPAWVRPLQLLISWVGTGIGYLRARPAAGLLGALAARAAIEPNPAPAYSIALVAIALFLDASRRVPVATVVAAAGFWTSQMVLDGQSGIPRLAFLLALVLWCGWIVCGGALDVVPRWSAGGRVRVVRTAGALAAAGVWALATFTVPADASPVLQRGSVGTGVRCVQWGINHLSGAALMFGPQTPVDGQYGPATAAGVEQFQAQYASAESGWRTVDGRVGPMTGTVLLEASFGGAPADWHCADHVPHDPKLRSQARSNLASIRREIATVTISPARPGARRNAQNGHAGPRKTLESPGGGIQTALRRADSQGLSGGRGPAAAPRRRLPAERDHPLPG